MLVHQHGPKLSEPFGRVFERGEDDRSLIDREREQLQVVGECLLEPVGELDGACGRTSSRLRGPLG